jgi:hypothetical protein
MSRANAVGGLGVGVALLAAALTGGCGGSKSAAPSVVTPAGKGTVRVKVAWPQTKAATAVSPASIPFGTQSVAVKAVQNSAVVASCLIVRPASEGTLQDVPCGTTVLGAYACSSSDGTGTVLAKGTTTITVHTGLNEVASLTTSPYPPTGPGAVYGTLTDAATGHVLSGTNVKVTTSDGTQLYQTTAYADGTFQLTGVPTGSRLITCSCVGYRTSSTVVVVGSSAVVADAALTAATGAPPSGAPQITLNDPVVDQATGSATLSGTITRLDTDQAVLIQNGQESAISAPGGAFSQKVVLQSGLNHLAVRATNAVGTTISRTVDVNYTAAAAGRFLVLDSNRAGGSGSWDVYLYDLNTGSLVSLPGLNSAADEWYPSIGADGRHIAFNSNRAGGAGGHDVYLYDRNTSSLVSLPGLNSTDWDDRPSISSDGRYIAFSSDRGGGSGGDDVYLYDRDTSSLVGLPGLNSGGGDSWPSISGDGRYIAFGSMRTGGSGGYDVYLYDRDARSLVGLPGLNWGGADWWPSVSSDGRCIVFASDRPGGVGSYDVYLYDCDTSFLVALPGLNSSVEDYTPGTQ